MAKDNLARDSLASVTLAGDILASDTLARVTLWPVTLWPVFLASFGVPKDEKKIIITFQKKRVNSFFKFFPMVPPMNFFSHFGSKKTGQSVTLAKVSLIKMSLWPKCH